MVPDPHTLENHCVHPQPAVVLDYHWRTAKFVAQRRSLASDNNHMVRIRDEHPGGDKHVVLQFNRDAGIALEIVHNIAVGSNLDLRRVQRHRGGEIRQAPAIP